MEEKKPRRGLRWPRFKTPKFLQPILRRPGADVSDRHALPVNIIRKDPFGNVIVFKRLLISVLAVFTYGRLNIVNRLKIEGTEHLEKLPSKNVLFISNHQTYYADVMALYHIFCSVKWQFRNTIRWPLYLLLPRANMYYIAAEETMKESGLIPKIFSYTGAVTVKRSWRYKGSNVQRGADRGAVDKIKKALDHGWVVNFPQGTTSPYAPVRKGVAQMIQKFQPIVVPVQIDGFRRAFDKKGLFFRKRGITLNVKFLAPLEYDPEEPTDELLKKIRVAIGLAPTEEEQDAQMRKTEAPEGEQDDAE
jgi:1-acyl-sn-glycerol-3-phosphate acyltransferase